MKIFNEQEQQAILALGSRPTAQTVKIGYELGICDQHGNPTEDAAEWLAESHRQIEEIKELEKSGTPEAKAKASGIRANLRQYGVGAG